MVNVDDLSLCMGILMHLHMCSCMMSMWMIYRYTHLTHIHRYSNFLIVVINVGFTRANYIIVMICACIWRFWLAKPHDF